MGKSSNISHTLILKFKNKIEKALSVGIIIKKKKDLYYAKKVIVIRK